MVGGGSVASLMTVWVRSALSATPAAFAVHDVSGCHANPGFLTASPGVWQASIGYRNQTYGGLC